MGLKAGWLALFTFVWIIGAFLGSTFDYQAAASSAGQSYTIGTATLTNGSDVVTSGGGAAWTSAMENGNIKADADPETAWAKIRHVGGGYIRNNSGTITTSPTTLALGANVITVTQLGTLTIVLPAGNTGTATSGVCTVTGSPVALVAGTNTISTTGVVGTINITTVGSTMIFLYAPYSSTGGAGVAYTMRATPGWAGTGTGGYEESPTTKMGYLILVFQAHQEVPLLGRLVLIIANPQFWETAFEVVTWQWSFLNVDNYPMFYFIFCAPFIVMGVLSMILLVYGLISGNLSWG